MERLRIFMERLQESWDALAFQMGLLDSRGKAKYLVSLAVMIPVCVLGLVFREASTYMDSFSDRLDARLSEWISGKGGGF